MKESDIVLKLRKALESEGHYAVKIVASGYMKRGIPDLLCCINGIFVGIECKIIDKLPKSDRPIFSSGKGFTEDQLFNLRSIQSAHGLSVALVYVKSDKKFLYRSCIGGELRKNNEFYYYIDIQEVLSQLIVDIRERVRFISN